MAKKKKEHGSKHLVLLNGNGDGLEEKFQDIIANGGKIDLKEAGEFDNYSEFAMFVKEGLSEGKFTYVELLEALYEKHAEEEYYNFKNNYGDSGSLTDDAFVNFIQDEHGPYTSVLVCETHDEIYLAPVEDYDETECYCNMLKELALAITNIHPERIPRKKPSEEVMNIVKKLSTPPDENDCETITAPLFSSL